MNHRTATIMLTANAYWRLEWLCHRTPNEVSAMGLFQPNARGILVADFILVKQDAGPASVSLDMDWWADKQIELYDSRGIEPWRTSCWAHSHPAGVNHPSMTDERTMAESFGGWDFILMLILTKAGQFYARMDFDHDFGTGTKQRLSVPCAVEIDWANPGDEPVSQETIKHWEEEFSACVSRPTITWFLGGDGPSKGVNPRQGWLSRPKNNGQNLGEADGKEMEEYVQACESMGYDPNDPNNFEDYFGNQPFPES